MHDSAPFPRFGILVMQPKISLWPGVLPNIRRAAWPRNAIRVRWARHVTNRKIASLKPGSELVEWWDKGTLVSESAKGQENLVRHVSLCKTEAAIEVRRTLFLGRARGML